jgi:hypothetical protein
LEHTINSCSKHLLFENYSSLLLDTTIDQIHTLVSTERLVDVGKMRGATCFGARAAKQTVVRRTRAHTVAPGVCTSKPQSIGAAPLLAGARGRQVGQLDTRARREPVGCIWNKQRFDLRAGVITGDEFPLEWWGAIGGRVVRIKVQASVFVDARIKCNALIRRTFHTIFALAFNRLRGWARRG